MFDNDPHVMKKKQSVIDVGQRTQLDLMNSEIRRNKEVLSTLRLENAQLQVNMQQAMRGKHQTSSEEYFRREEEQLHNKLCVLKRSLNSVKGKKEELAREIERTIEETKFVMKEGDTSIDENSAVGQKIRGLENRLDKCLIKHNEVNAIRRTYEALLERLQQEQAGFDTQLAAMERTLQNKDKDLADLNVVATDAAKGRDAAKAEVQRLKVQIVRERRAQKKDLEERRTFVQTKRDQLERRSRLLRDKIEKGEERWLRARMAISNSQKKKVRVSPQRQLRPEELEWQTNQREVYNRLKELTMSNNVTDVIFKLREWRDVNIQLLVTAKEAEATDKALKEERRKLQAEWDELLQQNGALGNKILLQLQQQSGANSSSSTKGASHLDNDDVEAPAGTSGVSFESVIEQCAHVRRCVLEEFDAHLADRRHELDDAQRLQENLGRLLLNVEAGVRHLAEKVALGEAAADSSVPQLPAETSVPPASSSCAGRGEAVVELLRGCREKLQRMLAAMRAGEVEAAAQLVARWNGALPESNIRVRLDGHHGGGDEDDFASRYTERDKHASDGGEAVVGSRKWLGAAANRSDVADDFPENEIHDRHELKMMSIATVERERKKAKKQLQQRSKEENH